MSSYITEDFDFSAFDFNVMEQNFNQQYKNCMKLIDDMKLVNDTYKNRRKEGAE